MYTDPTVQDFKNYFVRDFPYNADSSLGVMDSDITNAFNLVDLVINQGLWGTQGAYTIGFLYLAAHFLVLNIRASSQGLNGQYNWAQNSKSVGSVSESFTIPERIINNPELMQYTKTNYGAQYLQLVLPLLTGQVFSVCGGTHP